MSLSRVSKKARALSLAAVGMAVTALAGGMAVMSTSAQADTGTCGLLKANVIGTYPAGNFEGTSQLELNNDNTASVTSISGGATLHGTWAFQDSAIIVTLPEEGVEYHLIPQCAGLKLKPEALLGLDLNQTFQNRGGGFYRNAT